MQNLSRMTAEALMDLRKQVDETLLKRRADIEKHLAAFADIADSLSAAQQERIGAVAAH